jgi:hypothetical protein
MARGQHNGPVLAGFDEPLVERLLASVDVGLKYARPIDVNAARRERNPDELAIRSNARKLFDKMNATRHTSPRNLNID